ncbi:MAG: PLP-dependent aminotransferase family protein [Alphaproteobacteria bacterium]|nr:PLP-dependent aminotransferase family protein [Alphaproteobacteria bacterium]
MNLPLQLDRAVTVPLQDQLFEQLRQLIITGKLKPNSRVIATRFLAEQIGVSRTTVLLAYERLINEGYLETRPAIGTFVCAALPEQRSREAVRLEISDIPRQASLHPQAFDRPLEVPPAVPECTVDFNPERCDSSNLLPTRIWLKVLRSVFDAEPDGLAKPQPPRGVLSLRRTIVDYLAATRGVMTSPEQVIMVTGRRQAASFVAHLFQRPGDRVVLESPGDKEIADFFRLRKASLVHVPVDERGLETDALPQGPVSLAYVTPARQNPLGPTMPQARREALLAWARETGAYLIEDDTESELRYHGTTPPPLAAIDPYGLVFYAGSFTKTLGAGLGLGYLVVPAEFTDAITAIKLMMEAMCPWLEQMVVANLLGTGEYDHHLRRVRKVYLERRDCLMRALRDNFGEVQLLGTEVGTQLTWMLPDTLPSAHMVRDIARAHGVGVSNAICGCGQLTCDRHGKALILGYAALEPDILRDGVARLADALCH